MNPFWFHLAMLTGLCTLSTGLLLLVISKFLVKDPDKKMFLVLALAITFSTVFGVMFDYEYAIQTLGKAGYQAMVSISAIIWVIVTLVTIALMKWHQIWEQNPDLES